jgi:hypothetical protein
VLGGSVAGLLAARVLSDHASRVVIIERDNLPAEGQPRPGTPQDQQVHTLLPAGYWWMERWFPGLIQEALARTGRGGPSGTSARYARNCFQSSDRLRTARSRETS